MTMCDYNTYNRKPWSSSNVITVT